MRLTRAATRQRFPKRSSFATRRMDEGGKPAPAAPASGNILPPLLGGRASGSLLPPVRAAVPSALPSTAPASDSDSSSDSGSGSGGWHCTSRTAFALRSPPSPPSLGAERPCALLHAGPLQQRSSTRRTSAALRHHRSTRAGPQQAARLQWPSDGHLLPPSLPLGRCQGLSVAPVGLPGKPPWRLQSAVDLPFHFLARPGTAALLPAWTTRWNSSSWRKTPHTTLPVGSVGMDHAASAELGPKAVDAARACTWKAGK